MHISKRKKYKAALKQHRKTLQEKSMETKEKVKKRH
jgi:hypothetical protein